MGAAEVPDAEESREPILITLGAGVELQGRVTDPDGAPIVGAAVVVAESAGFASPLRSFDLEGAAWTRTGADGRFSTRLRTSPHDLVFEAGGRAARSVRGYTPAPGSPLDVVLDAAAEIRGRVVRPDGSGAPDLQVMAWSQMERKPAVATTAGDGSFALGDLTPGTYQVQVLKNDQPLGEWSTLEAPSTDARLQAGATGRIDGRVVDAATGRPVTRFEVSIEGTSEHEWERDGQSFPAEADDEVGHFSLDDVPAGDLVLSVNAAGYVARRIDGVAVGDDGATREVEVCSPPVSVCAGASPRRKESRSPTSRSARAAKRPTSSPSPRTGAANTSSRACRRAASRSLSGSRASSS